VPVPESAGERPPQERVELRAGVELIELPPQAVGPSGKGIKGPEEACAARKLNGRGGAHGCGS